MRITVLLCSHGSFYTYYFCHIKKKKRIKFKKKIFEIRFINSDGQTPDIDLGEFNASIKKNMAINILQRSDFSKNMKIRV